MAPRRVRALPLPARVGGLRVAATQHLALDSEAVAAASTERGDGLVVLVQIPRADAPGASALAEDALSSLIEGASIHAALAFAQQRLSCSATSQLALGIIAVLPTDGCVEVLNAGLPPIVYVRRDGSSVAFPARSPPLVARDRTPHPYERVAVAWDACWLMAAGRPSGFDLDAALRRARKLDLAGSGPALASLSPDSLAQRVRTALAGEPAADALLVIGAGRHALDRGASSV